jgi:hypothetical protein
MDTIPDPAVAMQATKSPDKRTKPTRSRPAHEVDPRAPNYPIIGIGLLVIAVGFGLQFVGAKINQPLTQAVSVGLGMALALYGVNPKLGEAARVQYPPLERLKLSFTGPTAVGLMVGWFVWHGLMSASADRLILLQNDQDVRKNSAVLSPRLTVTLIDVDSLKPRRLHEVVDAVIRNMAKIEPEKAKEHAHAAILQVTGDMGFSRDTVARLLNLHDQGLVEEMTTDWVSLVASEAQRHDPESEAFINRVRTQPFAILKLSKDGTHTPRVLLPGSTLDVDGQQFAVPVIANPNNQSEEIKEAVVLHHYKASQ